MLLTSALIVGTLYAGVKAIQSRKGKKAPPRIVVNKKITNKKKRLSSAINEPSELGKVTYQKSKKQQTIPSSSAFGLLSDTRLRQLKKINRHSTEEEKNNEEETEINRYLTVSVALLAVTTVSSLVYPPLNLLTLPAFVYTAIPVFKGAYHLIVKEKKVGVALVDAIAVSGPIVTGHLHFVATSVCASLYYYSKKLLIKTEEHSRKTLINVFGEQPRFIWILKNGVEIEIPFEEVQVGDTVVMDAGQTIPIDGTITSGVAQIDQRSLTGESQPAIKTVGDQVFASTIVIDGRISIRLEKTGKETVAAQIGDILNNTADFKSSTQSRGQKIVDQGAVPTLALSALTLPILGIESALAILFASFGYHMRIAAPLSVLNFLHIASQNGILIKDGRSLELLSKVDTIVFDKTGTLTEEIPTVRKIVTFNGYEENELLVYAAAAEYKQTHPIALAIIKETKLRELNLPSTNEAKIEIGYGLAVRIGKKLIRVGSQRYMEREGIAIQSASKKIACHEDGYSLVYVAIDNQLGGTIELQPTIRSEVKNIIHELRKRQISIYIISGDHEKPTQKLAQALGISHYFAEILPQNKANIINQLQNEGKSICFVGDGINDSIALKKANVSISLSGASTVATDTAPIIFMDGTLKQLIRLLDIANDLDANLSKSTMMTMLPGITCIGGVFFLHFGLNSAMMLYNLSLSASVSNAMLPRIKHYKKESKKDRK
ncbi:MAG: heavy metal translocating P-type ATPase [Pseudomonadota bacterium]